MAAAVTALALAPAGCASHPASDSSATGSTRVTVACTISTICSLVQAVGGDRVEVRSIVPVGVSPETYEPTPDDVVAVSRARVLIENGSGLEIWLQKLLANANAPDLVTVVLSDGIPQAERNTGNPHLWLDPHYASVYVNEIEAALSQADPAHAAEYRAGARAENRSLARLDAWIRSQIGRVPPTRRVMICFHDAWFYFDRRYGIEDIGAIERSPGQEPSPGYFAQLAAQARSHHVKAIFGEPQFSPKLADALASEVGLAIVSQLYDDTLGTTPALSNYDGMLRYDVSAIVSGLNR